MSLAAATPFLSKKQQNKSIANKKKSTKSIRNVLTFKPATHWPLITDEAEKLSILNILNSASTKNASKNEFRSFIKFGINEIIKYINKDDCKIILLDADVPRTLSMHVISTAISKSIPLLCIQGLKETINDCFGFKSSSICFTNAILEKSCSDLPKISMDLCHKHFDSIYAEKIEECKVEEVVVKKKNTIVDIEGCLDYIQLDENKIIIDGGKKSKRKCSFQPLLIKRVRMNPDR